MVRVRRFLVTLVVLSGLAGCGDPLRKVERLEDVDIAETTKTVDVAAPKTDTENPTPGLLSALFKRKPAEEAAEPAEDSADAALPVPNDAATGDAEAIAEQVAGGLETSVDTDGSAEPVAKVEPKPERKGLLGWLRGSSDASEGAAKTPELVEAKATVSEAQPDVSAPVSESAAPVAAAEATATQLAAGTSEAVKDAPKKGGLASLFRRSDREPKAEADETGEEETAALKPRENQGLFGRNTRGSARKASGPDARVVPVGTRLPYGEVARVCDAGPRQFGKEIARYPDKGRGYRLYDSYPGAVNQRNFYLTGFKDRCARVFTAALVVFGSAGMHEQLRYGRPAKIQPYSNTDKSYEKVKSKVCRVKRGKPCGKALNKLEKNTVFVSFYDRFGGSSRWGNFLLHNGVLVARDIKAK